MEITSIPGHGRHDRDYHIVKHMGGWNVKQENTHVPEARFETQAEAIGYGISLARHEAVSLIIHGRDGRFREVYNYRPRTA